MLVTSQQSGGDRFITWRLPSDIRDFTFELLRLYLTEEFCAPVRPSSRNFSGMDFLAILNQLEAVTEALSQCAPWLGTTKVKAEMRIARSSLISAACSVINSPVTRDVLGE
jgi:hypothetical protein